MVSGFKIIPDSQSFQIWKNYSDKETKNSAHEGIRKPSDIEMWEFKIFVEIKLFFLPHPNSLISQRNKDPIGY